MQEGEFTSPCSGASQCGHFVLGIAFVLLLTRAQIFHGQRVERKQSLALHKTKASEAFSTEFVESPFSISDAPTAPRMVNLLETARARGRTEMRGKLSISHPALARGIPVCFYREIWPRNVHSDEFQ